MTAKINSIEFEPYEQNISIVKTFFCKKSVLIAAIINYLQTLLLTSICVLNAVFKPDALTNFSKELSMITTHPVLLSGNVFFILFSAFFPIIVLHTLTAIALSLIYIKSKKPDTLINPKNGFSLYRITSIIKLIFSIVFFTITLMTVIGYTALISQNPSVLSLNLGDNASMTPATVTLIAFFGAIFLTIFLFYIVFYIYQIKFINGVNKSMSSPNLSNKGSGSLSAFYMALIICLSLTLLALIGSFIVSLFSSSSNNSFPSSDQISNILIIASIVLSLINCIILFLLTSGWKNKINSIKNAHLIDYNDGYDSASTMYMNQNQSQDQTQQSNEDIVLPSWNLEDDSSGFEYSQPSQNPSIIICPECNTQLQPHNKFCINCGHKMQ